jgi:recombination protein RecT
MSQANQVKTQSTRDKLQAKQQEKQQEQQGQNAPAVQPEKKKATLAQLIDNMMPEFEKALPEHIKPERMARLALTCIRNNPKLQKCDPLSFLGAVMTAATLGLEPNTPMGESYIIPYGDKAEFQIGYQGVIKLALNTGKYESIYAHEVYPNDEFRYCYGLHKNVVHVPADIPEGQPTYFYAVYKLQNGGFDFVVWSTNRVKLHAGSFSSALKNGRSTPWKSDFISMAKKTVLLQVLKYAPKSVELAGQLTNDETVRDDIHAEPETIVVDDIPNTENSQGDDFWN